MLKQIISIIALTLICVACVEGATIIVPSTQIANCYGSDGEPSNLTLILDEAKYGLSGYKITLSFTSEWESLIKSTSFPDWTNGTNKIIGKLPGQTVTLTAADLYNVIQPGAVNVPLCSLEIAGLTFGTTSLKVDIVEMTDDYGKPVLIAPSPYSPIVIYSIPPLQSLLKAPRDMNHDGLLDDFNGNRVIDTNDVVVFFHSWSTGITNSLPVAPFDYNKNGRVDVNDVVEYFNLIW